jgi:hypothetical protein
MAQVKAINTRTVHKVDGHTIFNMVKNLTGADDKEVLKVITPEMVPMIGRNDAHTQRYWMRNQQVAETWDNNQQISWGNALKHIQNWTQQAANWEQVKTTAHPTTGPAPTIPSVITKVEQIKFPPLTKTERETAEADKLRNLLLTGIAWNERPAMEKKFKKMSYQQLRDTLDNVPKAKARSYPYYGQNKAGRWKIVTDYVASQETGRERIFYQAQWEKSLGQYDPAVLLMMGQHHPTYYMAWIIAKTYHLNNPEVKNVAGYEGRYKYRNWELKERYYPAIRKSDTLPKTTAGWPRYAADPQILTDFTMQEIANALKLNFGGVLQAKKDQDKQAITQAVDGMKKRRDNFLNNPSHTLAAVLSMGLDNWNKNYLLNYGTYTTAKHQRKNLPSSKMVLMTYEDLRKKMGSSKFKKAIKEYESKQANIRDTTIDGAKTNYKTAMSNVSAAKSAATKGSSKTPSS